MRELTEQVQKLATEELERANKKFSQFWSLHEGHSVLLEEIEESKDAIQMLERHFKQLWEGIKEGQDYCVLEVYGESVRKYAVALAAESIQVIAMTDKFKVLLERLGGDE